MTGFPKHETRLRVGGKVIRDWISYQVDLDMTRLGDTFTMSAGPITRELWDLVRPDTYVEILIDDVTVMAGFIDERLGDDAVVTISGRDRGGRMVDESMQLTSFRGILSDLARAAAGDWYEDVVLSNAENRDLLRGRGRTKARAASEPLIADVQLAPKKVEPGETRGMVLQRWLREARLLAWSSADGRQLIVGRPNYDQPAQYRFFRASGPTSLRVRETNVTGVSIRDSVAERYARVTCYGAFKGDSANYAESVLRNAGVALDGPNANGTGGDFQYPKDLLISDDSIKDQAAAEERAREEKQIRDASGHVVTVEAQGHGQAFRLGEPRALYAPDTICGFEDEVTGTRGVYLLTRVQYRESRGGGQTTGVTLVRRGTELTQ